jgi:hypothetical protein
VCGHRREERSPDADSIYTILGGFLFGSRAEYITVTENLQKAYK